MGMLDVTEEDLRFARQIGVTDLVTRPRYTLEDGYYQFEQLIQLRARIEAAGLRVAALHGVPSQWDDKIRCGVEGRDEQIDKYCQTLENVGRAGVPILGYSFHGFKSHWRTSLHTPGRGGALFSSYDHALVANAPILAPKPLGDAARWEAYEHFIRRVMPVAEEAGVKMALHPDDAPISPIAGDAYIFRDPAAFQRAIDLVPSPSNGLLFCQGCWTEMLGTEVYGAIRQFGEQGKVFYVHFRNVVGRVPEFREAFIDSGDIDMVKAMTIWKDVGFEGPMMPDHYPRHMEGDTRYGHRARGHAIGYMKALMEAVGANTD